MTATCPAKRYYVVPFTEDNSINVIPSSWFGDDQSWWPNYTSDEKINKAIKNCEKPCPGWQKYSARIICAKDDYLEARRKMEEYFSSDTAGLQSEDEGSQRTRKKKRCHCPDPFAGLQDLGEGRSYTDLSFLTSSRPPQFSSVNHNPSDTSPLIIPNGRSAREFSNTINAPGYQDMQGFKGKRLRPNTQLCLVNPSWSCFLRHQPFAHVRQEKQSTSNQPNVHTTKPCP
ncbi:hypothetical protein DPEC_G00179180 [Dallia pectoralis]|uniref:Uncharacterized protein n=1 Tax=Dallia pectoralis TaxID=75939 RepID=A0ACC2GF47_DALPE|nr:hypothetical protein DPEC_G00179180 [Dallia pectoralis]